MPRRRFALADVDLDEAGVRLWIYRLICVFWFTMPWAGVVKIPGGGELFTAPAVWRRDEAGEPVYEILHEDIRELKVAATLARAAEADTRIPDPKRP